MNNNTLPNHSSFVGCSINLKTVPATWLNTVLVSCIAAIFGNVLLIVVIQRTAVLRTTTNLLVANMTVSNVFLPAVNGLNNILLNRKVPANLSHTTGAVLCKFFGFFINVSYGVSMLSLVVITVYRFYAVTFPMRARVHNTRTCIILIFLTWVLPITMCSPNLFFYHFHLEYRRFCYMELSTHYLRIWNTIRISFFFFLPLLVMLVLYPVIIVRLRRQKIPGNANCSQAVIRRRKQNLRLTTMFLTITVAFILCWGSYQVVLFTTVLSLPADWCTFIKVASVVSASPLVFHVINPVIYLIFCSSYRQGIKQLLSCCCGRTLVHHAPCGDQKELSNIAQVPPPS